MREDLEVPTRRWPKMLAFGVGFAAAIGSYLFARPRLATWHSWVTTHLAGAASSAVAPTVAAVGPSSGPSSAGAPLEAQRVEAQRVEAQRVEAQRSREPKATRHRPRHREAAKH